MKRIREEPHTAAFMMALLLAGAGVAQAQSSEVYNLPDTLLVVGERIPIDPIRAPMATTDVPASSFQDTRQYAVDQALSFIPGVIAQGRAGSPDVRVTIRGFGARGAGDRSNAGTTRGIRFLLDGFPITEPDGRTSFDLPDLGTLERVRVVRSNASALFGSASGGLVNFVTKSDFQAPFYDARTSYGSFGFSRYQGEAGWFAGATKIRASVSKTDNEGWREHSEADQLNVQSSISIQANPRASVGIFLNGARNRFQMPGALTREEFQDDPRQADPVYASRNDRRDNRLGRVGVKLNQRLGEANSLLLTGYLEPKTIQRSERNRFRDFQRVHTGGSAIYSQRLPEMGRIHGRWNLGIEEAFQDGSVLFYNLGPNGSRGTDLVANSREGNNNFGVFTEVDLEPHPSWNVTLGGRWDFLKYISEDFIEPELNAEKTLDRASPRVAVSYSYREGAAVYGAISGGIEGPAFNEVDPPPDVPATSLNPFLDPARSLTFEVGTKGRIPVGAVGGDELSYDVAAYTLTVKNDIIPWNGGAYYFTAGESRRRGIEIGATLDTDIGLTARASANFSDNEYIDYVRDDLRFDGNESAGIPSTMLQGGLRYDGPQGVYAEERTRFVGEYFADDANTDEAKVPFYTLFDLTVGVDRTIGGTNVGVFVSGENLTDENYVSSVFINGVNGRFFEPGAERSILFGLRVGGDLNRE